MQDQLKGRGAETLEEDINAIYRELTRAYGTPQWWPADTPYEVMAGAVLTQNTNWANVEKALASFGGRLTAQGVEALALDELKLLIRPAGFFNQKAHYLKELTRWFAGYDYSAQRVRQEPMAKIRRELLGVKGVGEETADSILLYAFVFPSFVVDAYTLRLIARLPLPLGTTYRKVKESFERYLVVDARLYNDFHALIVLHGKAHCRKKPLCSGCPLSHRCQKLGVAS